MNYDSDEYKNSNRAVDTGGNYMSGYTKGYDGELYKDGEYVGYQSSDGNIHEYVPTFRDTDECGAQSEENTVDSHAMYSSDNEGIPLGSVLLVITMIMYGLLVNSEKIDEADKESGLIILGLTIVCTTLFIIISIVKWIKNKINSNRNKED